MNVSVIVPYRPDAEGYRTRRWEWVQERWRLLFPDFEIVTGEPTDPTPNPGQFNRPQAINAAAAEASGDVLIVNDCDTAWGRQFVLDAVRLVVEREVAWAMPQTYLQLCEGITAEIMLAPPSTDPLPTEPVQWRGDTSVSGIFVIRREAFDAVGGFDERHHGWGWDDISFSASVDTLWGPYTRLPGYCYHLWHPQPPEHAFGQPTNAKQQQLFNRYAAARDDRDAMLALIAER